MGLESVGDHKAQGCDGFNDVFFKKQKPTMKREVYNVVSFYSNTSIIYKAINCTCVTLKPKMFSASAIKKYRPIV